MVYLDLIDAISNGKFALLSLLNQAAAFDVVDHNILQHRLEITFGFREVTLQWMRSYLDGRTQSILLEANRLLHGQRYMAYLKVLYWGHCHLRFTRPTLARSSINMV